MCGWSRQSDNEHWHHRTLKQSETTRLWHGRASSYSILMSAFQIARVNKRISRPTEQFPTLQHAVAPNCFQIRRNRGCFHRNGESAPFCLHALSTPVDGGVLSTEDIVVGIILALLLAFITSFLQGRGSQDNYVLWRDGSKENESLSPSASASLDTIQPENLNESNDKNDDRVPIEDKNLVFDGDSWKEMSRPENYVYYKRNLGKKKKKQKKEPQTAEQKLVVVALLALFVPIFSIEFFFALSRQVFCGSGGNGLLTPSEFAQFLCSPV